MVKLLLDIHLSMWYNELSQGGGNLAKYKTFTSNEVKTRWKQRNYKAYQVNLRYDTDRHLIDYVIGRQEKGQQTSEIFKEALEALVEKDR